MKLTLACDHRVVDGATGAKFLQTLSEFIENPLRIVLLRDIKRFFNICRIVYKDMTYPIKMFDHWYRRMLLQKFK